ncbi:MAG: hypothetical protein ABIF71_12860 [Planctomycetota bacterium]
MEQPPQNMSSFTGCWFRIFWMFVGNFGLFFSAYAIADTPGPFMAFTVADIAYGGIALALVIVRLIDIKHLHGTTAEGKPATMGDYAWYLKVLIPVAIALWLAAHGIAALRA